jgi:putative ABC transport system permease protein
VNRLVTELVGAVVEAWAELRIHKTRVLLSLIGVAVAVAAITCVVGVGAIAQQALTETSEKQGGRPALISISAYNERTGMPVDAEELGDAVGSTAERYSIDYASWNYYTSASAQFATGVAVVNVQAVDVDYGTMHRVELAHGSWFTDADEDRLAPAIVVNDAFWKLMGSPDLDTHPVAEVVADGSVSAVVVGVLPPPGYDFDTPSMTILFPAWQRIAPPVDASTGPSAMYELWVPPEISGELVPLIERDIAGAFDEGVAASVNRQDYLAYESGDPLLPFKLVIGGVAVLVLLLGALGLVNISLVTVRQRIREIGIRRSFGATAGRVFFAVMMESVVATLAAGVVGVTVAVLVVQNPWVRSMVGNGVQDLPAFPIEAAIFGLAASAVVGALAGLLPALVAVRVKVIDAIRY